MSSIQKIGTGNISTTTRTSVRHGRWAFPPLHCVSSLPPLPQYVCKDNHYEGDVNRFNRLWRLAKTQGWLNLWESPTSTAGSWSCYWINQASNTNPCPTRWPRLVSLVPIENDIRDPMYVVQNYSTVYIPAFYKDIKRELQLLCERRFHYFPCWKSLQYIVAAGITQLMYSMQFLCIYLCFPVGWMPSIFHATQAAGVLSTARHPDCRLLPNWLLQRCILVCKFYKILKSGVTF